MRKLSDWVTSYQEYMEETESARILHLWTALSVIGAVLRKKVFLPIGRINIYPNMYVVFVGPPGGPRKSQAISFGVKFLTDIPDVIISADAITPQALIEDLEKSAIDEQMADGSVFRHASLTITSKEFESFLGQKADNTRMITYLTDLFDAQEIPWKYRTKHSGTNVIPSVFLHILAATTPDSIASTLPSSAIGTGLTSRIIFVWVEHKEKKVCYPIETPEEKALKEKLKHDLYIISRMSGGFIQSKESFVLWKEWYDSYDALDENRICRDPIFTGWYERKPLYIQKLAIIYSASEGSSMTVEWKHFQRAISTIEGIEHNLPNVFKAVGRSNVAVDVDKVNSIIEARKWITEKELLSLTWRDLDSSKLDNVIDTLLRSGSIERKYIGPKGERGSIWYKKVQ